MMTTRRCSTSMRAAEVGGVLMSARLGGVVEKVS
jgi:hypothetical protein